MSQKLLLSAMTCLMVAGTASLVSAQDWWNPGTWGASRPYYSHTTRYGGSGSSCSQGVCRPSYGAGSYQGYGNPGWSGYRPPTYQPAVPNYRSEDRYGGYETYHRKPQSNRARYSPFYE